MKTEFREANPGRSLEHSIENLARRYPQSMISSQLSDVRRIAFHLRLVLDGVGAQASVCDLGGGVGLFSLACAEVGMRVTLVDDFADPVNREFADLPLTLHQASGVRVVSTDVASSPPDFPAGSLDAVTTFDSIEHWHCSPRPTLHKAMSWLRPGGMLIIGVPNCVNLRKRMSVPLGHGKWSPMQNWYEETVFRGHVREPDVDDLRYIARDLGLQNPNILGRNWLGYHHPSSLIRAATHALDRPLRYFPSLCADLYLIGRKSEVRN